MSKPLRGSGPRIKPSNPFPQERKDKYTRTHFEANRRKAAQKKALQDIIEDPATTPREKLKATEAYRKLMTGTRQAKLERLERMQGKARAEVDPLTPAQTKELRDRVVHDLRDETGVLHLWYLEHVKLENAKFVKALRPLAEKHLYVFAKFILGMKDLTSHLHKPVCEWLQNMDMGRRKLLMLPVVHLKTSIASQAFPLHVLMQPKGGLYFPQMEGPDARILLNGETEAKAKENLSFVSQHLDQNPVLRALWPHHVWPDKSHAADWGAESVTLPRKKICAEATVTAIGVGTDLHGRHYDLIIGDDLATMKAAQSELVMDRAKMHRKGLFSRLDHPENSIMIGVGTHWTPTDIYVDWRKDPTVAVMIRAAIENGKPLWPERHSIDSLLKLQAEEGMGKVLFSANYMNNPLNAAFTALDFDEVRTYWIEDDCVVCEVDDRDGVLEAQTSLSALQRHSALRGESMRGMPLSKLYPSERRDETPIELEVRRLQRLQQKIDREDEGSARWIQMRETFDRMNGAERIRKAEERARWSSQT